MGIYICSKCNKSFKYLSKLKEHNNRKTPCVSVGIKKTLQDPSKPFKTLPRQIKHCKNTKTH